MTASWRAIPAVLVAAALAVAAPAALGETVVVGDATLTPAGGTGVVTGQDIPVFQGDAGAGYTVAAPRSGTVVSWSFLSAGIDPGRTFVLRVLRPAAGGGWTSVGTSAPGQVTSAALTDAVAGPFAASLPIQAGDHIALQPTDDSRTPIEPATAGVDGVRFFAAPFADGVTVATSPASAPDNGQIVPVQATVETVPPRPDTPAPPAVIRPPSISGTPASGQVLTCDPGAWSGAPTFTETWYRTKVVLLPGVGGLPPHVGFTFPTVAAGPTYAVPDLAPGTSIGCTVTATNGAGAVTADADPVRVRASVPSLALARARIARLDPHPRITAGVGYGGTNTCTTGTWLHYPARYAYAWFTDPHWTRSRRLPIRRFSGTLVGTGPSLTIGAREEYRHLVCRVTATNAAGSGVAYSNVTFVPQLAPRADGPGRIFVTHPFLGFADQLDQSLARPVHAGPNSDLILDCDAPGYNRPQVALAYRWELRFPPQSLPGGGIYPGNDLVVPDSKLELGLSTPQKQATVDGKPLLGYVLVTGSARCTVTATVGRASTDSTSGRLYFTGPK